MANLIPSPRLAPIPQLETTTRALGGPGAIMNAQAQALLDRLEYKTSCPITALVATFVPTIDIGLLPINGMVTIDSINNTSVDMSIGLVGGGGGGNVTLPVGTRIDFVRLGTGKVMFGTGDSLYNLVSTVGVVPMIGSQCGVVSLILIDTFLWLAVGDVAVIA